MITSLQSKVNQFLKITGMPTSAFCRHIKLSQTMLYYWLHGERRISVASENRIVSFMSECIKRLVELSR